MFVGRAVNGWSSLPTVPHIFPAGRVGRGQNIWADPKGCEDVRSTIGAGLHRCRGRPGTG